MSDSDDDENLNYLIAMGILTGMTNTLAAEGARKGSLAGKKANKPRNFEEAYERLFRDYFAANPKYEEKDFERRFPMPRSVFQRIYSTLLGKGIFVRKEDCTKKKGIYPLVRMTAALRMLAYGAAADSLNEYLQMGEDSIGLSMKGFFELIVSEFSGEYLREPTESDLRRIMEINTARGFTGCIGSIDCQHWQWKNCPVAWAGQFKGKEKKPTIVLEAIADGELRIWHAFFGCPGTLKDINVLDKSSTLRKIIAGTFPPSCSYEINGRIRHLLYYLADGIYPNWALFSKTINECGSTKEKEYDASQEAIRKDVERAFGVLVARFHILKHPARLWYRSHIATVMKACIILHNMVVESRRGHYESKMFALRFSEDARALFGSTMPFKWESKEAHEKRSAMQLYPDMWAAMVSAREERVSNSIDHFALKSDLIEHIWTRRGAA